MSKELEALWYFINRKSETLPDIEIYDTEDNKQFMIIQNALIPPTAEEVCKALSEIEGVAVRYEAKAQAFINEHEQTLIVMMDSGVLFRCDTLPPRLITLIGRFYEGVEKVGNEE